MTAVEVGTHLVVTEARAVIAGTVKVCRATIRRDRQWVRVASSTVGGSKLMISDGDGSNDMDHLKREEKLEEEDRRNLWAVMKEEVVSLGLRSEDGGTVLTLEEEQRPLGPLPCGPREVCQKWERRR